MKKLLYIDDDQEQLDLYKMSFAINAPQIDFYTESDPFKSIKRIREIKPDVVLLDLVMSAEMSGIDVLKLIRKQEDIKDILIIAFTNSMLTSVVSELNSLEVTEIWEKIKGTPKSFALKINKILNL
jgi:CheY-like chemotaxis protein